MNPSYFFLGAVRISADYESITPILNICMQKCIPYSDFEAGREGVALTFNFSAFKRLKREAAARGISYRIIEKRGVPVIFDRYKYRFGIYFGLVCAIALIIASHSFVWDIEVTGNTNVTTAEIRELLRSHGFGVGSYIPGVNTDKIENMILIDNDKISWISINIVGSVANVEVRENTSHEKSDESDSPANLIAKKSGIVEEVRILNGNVVVGAGQYVNKGELLVSGLYDSAQEGFRYTRAEGEVLARTVEEFFIDIPYEYEAKEYTGVEYYDKYLIFFDYSMNISKNSGKDGVFYDKISIVENYSLFGSIPTPFSYKTEKYLEYRIVSKTRSPEAAQTLAYFELEERLSTMADGAILIKKTVTPYVRDDRFMLHCTVVLIENIAETSEFEVDLDKKE